MTYRITQSYLVPGRFFVEIRTPLARRVVCHAFPSRESAAAYVAEREITPPAREVA